MTLIQSLLLVFFGNFLLSCVVVGVNALVKLLRDFRVSFGTFFQTDESVLSSPVDVRLVSLDCTMLLLVAGFVVLVCAAGKVLSL